MVQFEISLDCVFEDGRCFAHRPNRPHGLWGQDLELGTNVHHHIKNWLLTEPIMNPLEIIEIIISSQGIKDLEGLEKS